MATMAGWKSFVDENEAVNRVLEIVYRDEIAMAITCKVAQERYLTHTRKAELSKEDEKMSHMTIPRHKLETHRCDESNASESTAELHAGGDVLRAGVFTHSEPFCFTVSPIVGLPVFWLVCLVSGWFFGGAVLLLVLFCWLTGIPVFFAFRMHKVVINSKTVTIVMMSAAMEQKKFFTPWSKFIGLHHVLSGGASLHRVEEHLNGL